MKKTSLLILIITLFSYGSRGQTPLRWNYPCKPGTKCWNALTSVEDRQNACQITGIDLTTLSTAELLLITMEHPFFQSYVAHDSPLEGIGFALEGFNGLEEFKKRPDAMKALCDIYFGEDLGRIEALKDSAEMGAYSLKWIGVELIMADEALLNQMSNQEKISFLKQLHSQLLVKQRYRAVFGGMSEETSASIFDKLMHSMGLDTLEGHLQTDVITRFRKRLILRNSEPVEILLTQFEEYVKNH